MLIVIASGKGGCGKTTTALALGTVLQREGYAPVLLDLDPGASLTQSAGIVPDGEHAYDLLAGRASLNEALVKTVEGIDLVPGCQRLISYTSGDVGALADRLRTVAAERVVLVDTAQGTALPPVRAALAAADHVVVPIQPEPKVVERSYVEVLGALDEYASRAELIFCATMVMRNLALTRHQLTKLAQAGVELAAIIPRAVACSEADMYAQSVVAYAPESPPAQAYEDLGRAVIARLNKPALRRSRETSNV